MKNFWFKRIISGGQTGVDRAALDWAIHRGYEHGGYCPKGRKSEDGIIPERYWLTELNSENYPDRTRANVLEADITLLIVPTNSYNGRGSTLTLRTCKQFNKLVRIIKADEKATWQFGWAGDPERFKAGLIVNVAGPRRTSWQEAPEFTWHILDYLFFKPERQK